MFISRSLVALSLFVIGCAQGGVDDAGVDSGPGATDAAIDGGSGERDSGPMGVDSGPMGVDSGPMGADSGPMGADGGFDAGPLGMDAGFDAGSDAGPPPDCTTAADCSDGLACNGAEACVGGTCRAGTAFACDDGIACTRDSCVEGPAPSCNFAPDDTLCSGGDTCSATGCMAVCAESPCRLVSAQCGCPAGQGCYLSGTARLCAAAGTTAPGATCTGVSSCAPGSTCLNVATSGPAANMCSRFCDVDSDCAGGLCIYTINDGAGGAIPGVTVCTTPCDPIAQTGCPSSTSCQIFRESMGAMRYFADCSSPTGILGQGASCTTQADCAAGFACAGTPGTCLRWCDNPGVAGPASGCPGGLSCFGFTTPIRIGATTYGVCDT